jgi:AmmeMemoRadiSam system protein A
MQLKQRLAVLRIAREVIEAVVRGERWTPHKSGDPLFGEKRGCFVTIKNRGRLRGCIGTFQADAPLLKSIECMAEAATRDPRFPFDRITPSELKALDIEISVLSPLKKTSDPLSLELGKHGIYIRGGRRSGCFLPQVATELGWSKEEFLSHCCADKIGLKPDAWKDPETEVLLFTAEIFHSPEPGVS